MTPGIPIILPNGHILVYGFGYPDGSSVGIVPDRTTVVFSNVYQVWPGGEMFVYRGDSVMWKEGDEYCKLTYDGNPYTMLPARLVTKELILP